MKKILIFLTVATLFTFCTDTEKSVTMTYQMTQCADAWHNDPDYFNNKEKTLEKYLETQGITTLSVTVEQNCPDGFVCTACTCPGCDKAVVQVDDSDVAAMEKLKFVKK